MTLVPSAVVSICVLGAAGCLPVLALVGVRWPSIPLAPLVGAIIAAGAATGFVAVGGTFMGWFVGISVALALAAGARLVLVPRRPPATAGTVPGYRLAGTVPGYRLAGTVGALVTVVAGAWCLRGLATPTIGFDTRALWLLRAGWFLQPHHQLLTDMRGPTILVGQTAYPPLVSAAASVAWSITGNHSMRLGVVVIALVDMCGLVAAAWALVECGRTVAARRWARAHEPEAGALPGRTVGSWAYAPLVVGVLSAPLLVLVSTGITEPFLTNGYADPTWSIAAVGAVVYGLQLERNRSNLAAAVVMVMVAGLSKDEGAATAVLLVALIVVRWVLAPPAGGRARRWWRPAAVGTTVIMAILAWPVLMQVIEARNVGTSGTRLSQAPHRLRLAVEGFAPYLHVLFLAVPVAVVGGLLLSRLRRAVAVGNDWWGWAGLLSGLLVVGGTYLIGSGQITIWLQGSVHRVTEYAAMELWWIIAIWGVVGSAVLSRDGVSPDRPSPAGTKRGGADVPYGVERASTHVGTASGGPDG